MTVTQTDARPHEAAIVAALNAKLSPQVAYPLDGVPGTKQNSDASESAKPLPGMYAEVNIAPRYTPPVGAVPRETRGGWRAITICVGRTRNEAFWVMDRVTQALRSQYLLVQGERVGPLVRESAREPEWDNVRWSAPLIWIYST